MVKLLYHIFVRISSFFGSYHFNTYTLLFKFDVDYSAWENYDKNVYRVQAILNDVKELL